MCFFFPLLSFCNGIDLFPIYTAAGTGPGPYTGFAGHNEKEASGHFPVGQNMYDDAYGVPQVRRILLFPFFIIWIDFFVL